MRRPQAAPDHLRQSHQQLLQLALRACRSREDMRMAVALARWTFEGTALETSEPAEPSLGNRRQHPRKPQLIDAGLEELEWGVDAGAEEAARAGVGYTRKIGEAQAREHGEEVGVIDPLETVSLVEIGRLLRHPD